MDEEVSFSILPVGGFQGGQGGVLGDGGRTDGKGVMDLQYLVDNPGRGNHIAHPPSGHTIHFRKAFAGNQLFLELRNRPQAEMGKAIVEEEIVGLVRNDKKIPFQGHFGQCP